MPIGKNVIHCLTFTQNMSTEMVVAITLSYELVAVDKASTGSYL